ncbi:kinase-like protein, partial [Tothia fuscella]
MSSRTITSVVTADTIALNAAIFGYAGHSIVTPHQAIQQIWWSDERIEAKVNREFIVSKLRPNEREQLNKPIAFGRDLTDDTYLDWILRKAQRLYLILVECGVSDQIFGVVEDSWDDGDLPISLAEVDRLALSYRPDDTLNKKFYNTQFKFLLRPISKHCHIDYAPNEVIPVEFVHRLAPAAAIQSWSRLHLPSKPDDVFVRRRLQLGEKEEIDPALRAQFLADIEAARRAEHDHVAPVWASWTSKGFGYWMTPFVGEHTLKSFIEFRTTTSLQKLSKPQRHALLLDWMHCLADTVAFLHQRGICHGAIVPSNILVDGSNHVALSDIASLKSFHRAQDQIEVYTYGAPETQSAASAARKVSITSPPTTSSTSRSFFASPPTTSSTSRSFFGHRRTKSTDSVRSGSDDNRPSDIFSLACTYLEIISFIYRKKTTEFTKHRSTKHKNASGKGSHIDCSFHGNLSKVESWMQLLEEEAQSMEDVAFRAIPYVFHLIREMLDPKPELRPTASTVQQRIHDTLTSYSGLASTHCTPRNY